MNRTLVMKYLLILLQDGLRQSIQLPAVECDELPFTHHPTRQWKLSNDGKLTFPRDL